MIEHNDTASWLVYFKEYDLLLSSIQQAYADDRTIPMDRLEETEEMTADYQKEVSNG